MSVSPGPQFTAPPQEAPTLTEIINEYSMPYDLIPSQSTTLYASFGDKKFGQPERGAMVNVHGPSMHRYDEANPADPGALFSHKPAKIVAAYASAGDQSIVPSMLALAHKKIGADSGVIHTSDSLSPWSHKLAKTFESKGLAKIPNWTTSNVLNFSHSGSELADLRVMLGNTRSDPTKDYTDSYTYSDGSKERQEIKAAVPLEGALAEGRAHLRKALNGPKQVPVVPRIPQGVQERLF